MIQRDRFGRLTRAAVIVSTLAAAGGASAHGFLERAEPRDGSTVHVAPREVTLAFTERLEPAYSSAHVIDESGQPVHRGESRVDRANPTILRVAVRPLAPGAYRVRWRVLSVDAHITEGTVTFRVSTR